MKYFSDNDGYYYKYGLEQDPFPVDEIDNIYYVTPELNHRIELIKHLLEFSQQLLLVTAPPGAGKSTLCRYLPQQFDRNWPASVVEARPDMDAEALAGAVLAEIYPARKSQDISKSAGLEKYLDSCDRDQKLPVVIIDEGHKLPSPTLEYILQLNGTASGNTRFRFVILAEAKINELLDDPRIKISTTGIVHSINIPMLTEVQVSAYLEHRLVSSGKVTQYPFTERDAHNIYKVSGGVPGRINRLARQAMMDPAQAGGGISARGVLQRLRNPVAIAVIISLAFALYFFIWQERTVEPPESVALALPPEPQPVATGDGMPAEPAGQDEMEPEPEPLVIETPVISAVAEEPEPVTVTTVEEQGSGIEIVVTPTPAPEIEPVSEPEAEPVVIAAPQPPAPAATADTPEQLSRLFTGLKGGDWVRAQSPDRYMLQLIGARDIHTLEQYLEGLPELRNELVVISTFNAGQPWYVFLYGIYPDREAAVAGIGKLPEVARRSEPWPRTVASVLQDLEKTR